MVKLSRRLLKYFSCPIDNEESLRKELNGRLKEICKPCWELKYCPYGPLVENFPLPPLLFSENREHIEYLKQCLEHNAMGKDFDIPLDENRKKFFQQTIDNNCEDYCVNKLSKFEKEAACKEFGHLCPAFFVSECFTETQDGRNRSRNIPHSTVIRVVRRDNNTCQICGKILLDREIEIDHIIPFSRGGTSDESNLRVTCLKCNREKGNRVKI